MSVDVKLREFAQGRELDILNSVIKEGSHRKAAAALGVHHSGVDNALRRIRERAAREGYAPGFWEDGTAPGYLMGKVTLHRNKNGIEQRWERQHPTVQAIKDHIDSMIEAAKEKIPRLKPVGPPKYSLAELLTQYTVTDYHFGMQAHACEGGNADWNLDIAENLLVRAILDLASKSPASGTAVLALLGDLLHFDGPDPVTPTNRHPLDAAARQRTVIKTVKRAILCVVRILLEKHGRVVIVVAEGNHDIASTPWLAELLITAYENEPRVEILEGPLPYLAFQFGKVMLGFAHGHTKKKESLPLLFASMFREMWGLVRKVYIHCGHQHHVDEKESSGAKVIQHPTMAAPDSHASRGGWLSEREMSAIHYHIEYGSIGRTTTTPEML